MNEISDAWELLNEIFETLDTKKKQAKEANEQKEYDRLQRALDYLVLAMNLLDEY